MVVKARRSRLLLNDSDRSRLRELSGSRTAPQREVERARVLLRHADGESVLEIHRALGISRPSIYKCIDKALAAGIETGLKDKYHRPHVPEITPEDSAWVVDIACTKPKDHGQAAELWTLAALAQHVRVHAVASGHPRLGNAAKSTVWRILNAHEIKPHRIRYYLERRDPEFDAKMRDVLMVYREIAMTSATALTPSDGPPVYTVSLDEKPGIQALATTAPDLPPVPGKYSAVQRDYEYVRHGTVSILAAIDLHDGHVIAQVHDRHRSREVIELLKAIDMRYPSEAVIRVILDNHSAHISKETMAFLATKPGRFIYLHTPKHGSWLNLIESVFSKMARTFLRHIRVASLEELKARILQGIAEMNSHPVVFRWRNFDALIEL